MVGNVFRKIQFQTKLMVFSLCLVIVPLVLLAISSYQGAKKGFIGVVKGDLETMVKQEAERIKESWGGVELYEQKAHVIILQLRRQEKNFLLYGAKEGYEKYEQKMETHLKEVAAFLTEAKQLGLDITEVEVALEQYKKEFKRIKNYLKTHRSLDEIDQMPLRLAGRKLDKVYANLVKQYAEVKTLAEIKRALLSRKIGKSGYFYVLDTRGNLVVHPDSGIKSLAQYAFCQKILQTKQGFIFYDWETRHILAAYDFIPTKNWIIVASGYTDELLKKPLWVVKKDTLIIGLIFILLGTAISFIFSRGVNQVIRALLEKTRLIANGDLTVTVETGRQDEFGELAQNFNDMVFRLKELVKQVAVASNQIDMASSEVTTSSQKLAEGASEQAASLEETSSSMEEIASMAKQNADNALQTDQLMKQTQQITEETKMSMKELTKSMENMTKLAEETQKIVKGIDEIAFQTNLLALNAAVEAARAGEAGQGFAVVADEVRNLAQRTAAAAKDTAQLIDQTVKGIHTNLDLVKKVDSDFSKVEQSAARVGSLVAEISAASQEQTQGISQVNTAVSQMDKVTQQVASNAEELASASEELKSQAANLVELISHFKFEKETKYIPEVDFSTQLQKTFPVLPQRIC
ncbi:MAG: methyl-accepting chemotaxis protein [Candidatus Desulfofervidaceae bacterium]|nr:methyl-accepting chemotaxis protein [Candidatus Desulfofervidaceae bacterium]